MYFFKSISIYKLVTQATNQPSLNLKLPLVVHRIYIALSSPSSSIPTMAAKEEDEQRVRDDEPQISYKGIKVMPFIIGMCNELIFFTIFV